MKRNYYELVDRFIDWTTEPQRKYGHELFLLLFPSLCLVSVVKGLVDELWKIVTKTG